MKALIALLLLLAAPALAAAQTLPGSPFSCQTTCTAAMTATGTIPPAPFSCQAMCSETPALNVPTLPGSPFSCNAVCTAPSTPATIPATPFTCQQVCSAPYTSSVDPPPPLLTPVVTPATVNVSLPLSSNLWLYEFLISNPPLTAVTIPIRRSWQSDPEASWLFLRLFATGRSASGAAYEFGVWRRSAACGNVSADDQCHQCTGYEFAGAGYGRGAVSDKIQASVGSRP